MINVLSVLSAELIDRVDFPYSTAASIGMKKINEYPDPEDTLLYVYRLTRAEWEESYGCPARGRIPSLEENAQGKR